MAVSLHDHALNACKELQALSTGLAQANVDPNVVKTVQQLYDVCHKIAAVLGKGQEATGNNQPPAPQPQDQGPQQGPPSPADQGPPAPDQGSRPTLDSATADLHQSRVKQADARRQMLASQH